MSGYQPHTNVSTPVQHEGQVVHDFGDHQQAPLAQGYESTQATPVYTKRPATLPPAHLNLLRTKLAQALHLKWSTASLNMQLPPRLASMLL